MDILEGVTLFGQKVMFQHRNRNARNGAEQERRKRMRGGDDPPQNQPQQQQRYPNQMNMNLQYQQLAMAAQMGIIDPNILMQLSGSNYSPPSFNQNPQSGSNQIDLYKRTSQDNRARRRDEREVYHRPNNHNSNWGGRTNHNNQWNDRRSEQRRSGGNGGGNYR
ncbi:hypothetical protein ACFFRR_004046 [Megaselia abdita]